MAEIRGRFLWYENLTRDVQAAIGFYSTVIGWGTQRWEMEGQPYFMFANGETPLAGLHPMPPAATHPPHWLGYIGTPDVAATTALAESLGARVVVRLMAIPTVGTMSVMSDPQGAVFAAYQPETPPHALPKDAKMGEFSWHELATTDTNAALAFYNRLFGWEILTAHDMGHMGVYNEYGLPGLPLGGLYTKPAEMPGPPNWLPYVRIADLDAAVGRVRACGGTVMLEPHEVPGGDRIAVFADQQSAPFALHQKKG
jgi:predicted enzyme related to lactoylglutathione lyase